MNRPTTIVLSLVIVCFALPAVTVAALALLLLDGFPLFFRQTRIGLHGKPFQLLKLRTMKPDNGDAGVTGGDKASRLTRTGRLFRKYRLDELPQLVNVLRGDMALVGPRPPLPRYVEAFPELYATIMGVRPGITGLGSVLYSRKEEQLLASTTTAEQTESVYRRVCVPDKCRLERFYIAQQSLRFDLIVIFWTLARFIPLPGRRNARIRGSRAMIPATLRPGATIAPATTMREERARRVA
jgi:lipopolysaccharide/colanic/teichoic acid biosynthesis glycosyltransferase